MKLVIAISMLLMSCHMYCSEPSDFAGYVLLDAQGNQSGHVDQQELQRSLLVEKQVRNRSPERNKPRFFLGENEDPLDGRFKNQPEQKAPTTSSVSSSSNVRRSSSAESLVEGCCMVRSWVSQTASSVVDFSTSVFKGICPVEEEKNRNKNH